MAAAPDMRSCAACTFLNSTPYAVLLYQPKPEAHGVQPPSGRPYRPSVFAAASIEAQSPGSPPRRSGCSLTEPTSSSSRVLNAAREACRVTAALGMHQATVSMHQFLLLSRKTSGHHGVQFTGALLLLLRLLLHRLSLRYVRPNFHRPGLSSCIPPLQINK